MRPSEPPAQAQARPAAGVQDTPRTDTPRILDGAVFDSALVGDDVVVVGGDFTRVRDLGGTGADVDRAGVAAYRVSTGALLAAFDPQLDGDVLAVEASPDGDAVYLGGRFTQVDGTFALRVAKLDLDGTLDTSFDAGTDSVVHALETDGDRLFLGGVFSSVNSTQRLGLAAVDADDGTLDAGFDLPVTEPAGAGTDNRTVRSLDLSPDGDLLLSVHQALRIDGQDRAGVALLDVSGPTASVAPWRTNLYRDNIAQCDRGFLGIQDGEFSPDGSYLVTIGRGGDNPPACDSALRFETAVEADGVNDPTWVTRLHDSSYSLAVSEDAVFIGGHFYGVEAPDRGEPEPWWPGADDVRYGCDTGQCPARVLAPATIRREQIAALDPVDGKALAWNPGSSARQAVFSLEWTAAGLLVGQDRERLGDVTTGRHGLFPPGTGTTFVGSPTPGLRAPDRAPVGERLGPGWAG